MKLRPTTLTLLFAGAATSAASAQLSTCAIEEGRLYGSVFSSYEQNGFSVDISGDTIVSGAFVGPDGGRAFVGRRSGFDWVEEAVLVGSDLGGWDNFGHSVAIDGDTIVVGAPLQDVLTFDDGAAYVFERSGGVWTETAKLRPSDATGFERFGWAVAIEGDTIVVGALFGDAPSAASCGTAYVYTRGVSGWTEQAELFADSDTGDQFGATVAVEGDTILVGAQLEDEFGLDAGACYVFTRSGTTWSEAAKLFPALGAAGHHVGSGLAIDGDTVLVGSSGEDAFAGAVYEFTRSGTTWTQGERIVPPVADPADVFGENIGLSGRYAVITARLDDDLGPDAGAAYVFRREGGSYVPINKITPEGLTADYQFASSVGLSGESVVLGAPADDGVGPDSGACYVMHVAGDFETYGAGLAGSGGLVPALDATSCPSLGWPFTVEVSGGLGGALGALFISTEQASLPALGGTILVGAPTFLLDIHVLDGVDAGEGAHTFEFLFLGDLLAGLTFYVQAGYVDPGGIEGASLSNGLRASFP